MQEGGCVTNRLTEPPCASVCPRVDYASGRNLRPLALHRTGSLAAPLLTALERGVKEGGRYSLVLAQRLLRRVWGALPHGTLCFGPSVLSEATHQLESRVRENRTHGSEGGAAQTNAPSLPLS